MKKKLSAIWVLCLIITLMPGMALPVQAAAGGPEKALQSVFYYNIETEEILEESTTCVLVKSGTSNQVITTLPSKEDSDIYTVFTTENDSVGICLFLDSWNQTMYIYEADSELGENEGFTEQGTVTEGETVYLVLGWDDEGNKGGYRTTATAYQDGQITLADPLGEWEDPIPVLNSKNEVCAIYYGESCWTLMTDEETFYGESNSEEGEPTEEEPADEKSSASDGRETYGMVEELPELEELIKHAVVQKDSSNIWIIVTACLGGLAVVLATAAVLIRRKNIRKVSEELNEAEEGTQLADEPENPGLKLHFRNGRQLDVCRSFTIGRAPDNNVVVPKNAANVSGRHCEIIVQNGIVYLRDLGSTNGTFINGRRIPVGQPVKLQIGMNVSLGGVSSNESFQVVSGGR